MSPTEAGPRDEPEEGLPLRERRNCMHDQTTGRQGPLVVLFASDRVGDGPAELGRVLARSFVKTLHEQGPLPWRMVFLNAGVALTTEGSVVAEDLRAMEAAGAEVLSCGTCLDYFHTKEKLLVGRVSNMREIVETVTRAGRLLRP
jgi:selenium metabolism protein YedF